ncbi:MAG: sodium-dependent transporter [Sedimenticola sp.]|nr:sodium-dependent transporter [Sedimenticola sp.]
MLSRRISIHGQWSSRPMFLLAATGAVVGLGNIWRFPYLVGDNGGGAFILAYLLCLLLVGAPLLMLELALGKRGRQSPPFTLQTLSVEAGGNAAWKAVGWLGILTGLVILSYYSVVAGWTLAYGVRFASGVFFRVTSEGANTLFAQLVGDPERLLAWHTIFMVLTIKVVSRGVVNGLEKANRILVPLLLGLLLVLMVYAVRVGDFGSAYLFLFNSDFSQLSATGWLSALGHAFFTLGLGLGAILIYGAYLPAGISIGRTSMLVVLLDTLVGLVAGIAVFSLLFSADLSPGEGPGLIFQTLPIAFGQMPGGAFFGTLFFLLLLFAAWTSAIAMIEPAVAWLVESHEVKRVHAAIWTGIVAWLLGIISILSFSHWSFSFEFAGELRRHGLFDVLEILTSSIMLPLGGLLLALFAGWVMNRDSAADALGRGDGALFRSWYFLIRYIVPAAIVLIFLQAVGVV